MSWKGKREHDSDETLGLEGEKAPLPAEEPKDRGEIAKPSGLRFDTTLTGECQSIGAVVWMGPSIGYGERISDSS
jgi:hypothetical protein